MKNLLSRAAMSRAKARRWLLNVLSRRAGDHVWHDGSHHVVQRIWLLHESASATLDYLVLPALSRFGVEVVPIALDRMPHQYEPAPGTLVVVVRYINASWATFLDRHQAKLSGVIYFMDDDLFDKAARAELPGPYRKKLERLVDPFQGWLTTHTTAIWVSSAALEIKYMALGVELIDWTPAAALLRQVDPVWVFYHGSASHQAEQRWLRDIIASVLEKNESIHFEIIGDFGVNRLFRSLPRTSILHPMTWPNYLAHSGAVRRHIGLAPLLPGPYNAARGPTKFFDFARLGAVGIYTDVDPYMQFVRNGKDGVLVPNDASAWIEAILSLAGDFELRATLAQQARARALGAASIRAVVGEDGADRG